MPISQPTPTAIALVTVAASAGQPPTMLLSDSRLSLTLSIGRSASKIWTSSSLARQSTAPCSRLRLSRDSCSCGRRRRRSRRGSPGSPLSGGRVTPTARRSKSTSASSRLGSTWARRRRRSWCAADAAAGNRGGAALVHEGWGAPWRARGGRGSCLSRTRARRGAVGDWAPDRRMDDPQLVWRGARCWVRRGERASSAACARRSRHSTD
mmetsp:Transcript_17667/g.57504  ORF Transcript_17667/g.57504 Transcript_17667/m.57504 type:complete len:209 (+) Transcript_17667:622-1248(+)